MTVAEIRAYEAIAALPGILRGIADTLSDIARGNAEALDLLRSQRPAPSEPAPATPKPTSLAPTSTDPALEPVPAPVPLTSKLTAPTLFDVPNPPPAPLSYNYQTRPYAVSDARHNCGRHGPNIADAVKRNEVLALLSAAKPGEDIPFAEIEAIYDHPRRSATQRHSCAYGTAISLQRRGYVDLARDRKHRLTHVRLTELGREEAMRLTGNAKETVRHD